MIHQFLVKAELRHALNEMGVRTPTFLFVFFFSFLFKTYFGETSQVLELKKRMLQSAGFVFHTLDIYY